MAKPYEDIAMSGTDEIAVLTLHRPDVRNALRHETFAEIEDAVLNLSARVLIVTGSDPAFAPATTSGRSWARVRCGCPDGARPG